MNKDKCYRMKKLKRFLGKRVVNTENIRISSVKFIEFNEHDTTVLSELKSISDIPCIVDCTRVKELEEVYPRLK